MNNDAVSIVLSVQNNTVVVDCFDKSKFDLLKNTGAKRQLFNRRKWIINYQSKEMLSEVFSILRNNGFIFSGGSSGWYPSNIFRDLKENGYLFGEGLEIIWKKENKPIIRII
jgi:hypothetical protein